MTNKKPHAFPCLTKHISKKNKFTHRTDFAHICLKKPKCRENSYANYLCVQHIHFSKLARYAFLKKKQISDNTTGLEIIKLY